MIYHSIITCNNYDWFSTFISYFHEKNSFLTLKIFFNGKTNPRVRVCSTIKVFSNHWIKLVLANSWFSKDLLGPSPSCWISLPTKLLKLLLPKEIFVLFAHTFQTRNMLSKFT